MEIVISLLGFNSFVLRGFGFGMFWKYDCLTEVPTLVLIFVLWHWGLRISETVAASFRTLIVT